ncbi:hypothetical protein [Nocardia sp. NPDC046763]|uniref:hypothetical protein n=1 Tax=Nocardia sp. NPDC046763 TaxID=3155256 RepID=UPI0033EC8197
MLDRLAPDVVFLGDGGGVEQTALQPLTGAALAADLLVAAWPRIGREMAVEPAQINGYPEQGAAPPPMDRRDSCGAASSSA